MAGQQMFDRVTSHGLTVIPLFVLMGAFLHRSQLTQESSDAANALVGPRRGMGTIAACGGFGAVCGSSLATAATISKVCDALVEAIDRVPTFVAAMGGAKAGHVPEGRGLTPWLHGQTPARRHGIIPEACDTSELAPDLAARLQGRPARDCRQGEAGALQKP